MANEKKTAATVGHAAPCVRKLCIRLIAPANAKQPAMNQRDLTVENTRQLSLTDAAEVGAKP